MPYDLVMRRAVAQAANGLSRSGRHRFESFLDSLAKNPYQTGDFIDTDESGRPYDVKLMDDLVVTYWVDHLAKEVRIVDLELVDDR